MTLFRQEALDHKRRKLYSEVILVQPVRLFVITALFFVLAAALVFFLMNGEYKGSLNAGAALAAGISAPISGPIFVAASAVALVATYQDSNDMYNYSGEHNH